MDWLHQDPRSKLVLYFLIFVVKSKGVGGRVDHNTLSGLRPPFEKLAFALFLYKTFILIVVVSGCGQARAAVQAAVGRAQGALSIEASSVKHAAANGGE